MCVHCLLSYWYVILWFEYGSLQVSLAKNAIFLPAVAKNPPTSRIPVTLQLGQDWSVNLGLGPSSGMENEKQEGLGRRAVPTPAPSSSQISCSLSPSSHPQLWASKLSSSPTLPPLFWTEQLQKLSLWHGQVLSQNSIWAVNMEIILFDKLLLLLLLITWTNFASLEI